jgi:DNA-binding transcriptional ArsR family regulator
VVKSGLEGVTYAVASAPRRAIIERLAEGEASMSDLADRLAVTLPAVDKHLRVLLDAGVVTKDKTGRITSVRLVPGSLEPLAAWALSTRLMWGNALDRLDQHLSTDRSDSEETS